jgi:hypothetical protein
VKWGQILVISKRNDLNELAAWQEHQESNIRGPITKSPDFHLLPCTRDGNLSEFMRRFNISPLIEGMAG